MKMRKFFAMALVALGATAAFSSCQKDPKAYDAPKVEFRDGKNNVVTTFNEESFGTAGMSVVVKVGDIKEVKLDKVEIEVKSSSKSIKTFKVKKLIVGNSGDTKDKYVGYFTKDELGMGPDDWNLDGLMIKATAFDNQGKSAWVDCIYKKDGGAVTPGIAVEAKGWVNNNQGKANGGFSLTAKKSVPSADPTADLVNDSEVEKGISGKLKSNTGLQFAPVESSAVDYSTVTKAEVAKAAEGKNFAANIDGLKANSLFIAKDKTGTTFYLFKVTEIGANDKDYNGNEAEPTKSGNGNGGYMIFGYKSNK